MAKLAGYSGTPLPKKLGIKEEARPAIVGTGDRGQGSAELRLRLVYRVADRAAAAGPKGA